MSLATPQQNPAAPVADNASDYGSDLDDETALHILSQAEPQPLNNVVLESIEEPILQDESAERRINLRLSRRRQSAGSARQGINNFDTIVRERQLRESSLEVEYNESNRDAFSPSHAEVRADSQAVSTEPEKPDTRSPLERWRKPPKKPLSVTDLISPAWCEQQYEYSLSRYGRIRKTPAMKQGSSVHKELEEQVHVEVPVEVVSKEDRFGLRIWNTIQGLRTLRETGLTRELEIFGLVEGEVVIGIVDEIGTTCPDEGMEEKVLEEAKGGSKGKGKVKELPADQRTLTDFLTSSQGGYTLENHPAFVGALREKPLTYYVVDIKTRQSRTLPPSGSQSRPTHMQLMLYHRILTALASDQMPGDMIFERYKLNPYATFSDKFIAQIANLDISARAATTTTNDNETSPQTEDPLTELLSHNTLASLWTLLTREFTLTLPATSISPLLTAEFRTAQRSKDDTEQAGTLIGRRSFAFDEAKIDAYVKDEMRWWKGERETRGVEIEEAFKCRICEFAEGCVWRETKVEEGVRKARLRGEGRRRRSEV